VSPTLDVGDVRLGKPASLSGTLVDDAHSILPKHKLRLTGGPVKAWPPATVPTKECRTDDLGRFSITDLAAGSYSVEVGWPASRTPITVPVTLANGEDRRGLELVLPRGLEISGVVRDAEDKPVPRAQITLELEQKDNGFYKSYSTTTDREGRFSSQGLRQGTFTLVVWPEREMVAPTASSHVSPKALVGVEAGTRDVDIHLASGAWVHLFVLDSSGSPAPNVYVFVYDAEHGTEFAYRRTDGEGRFAMLLDRTRLWNIVATLPVGGASNDPRPDLEPGHTARADGIAPGGPDVELRLPPR
jgi:hypothetical protein